MTLFSPADSLRQADLHRPEYRHNGLVFVVLVLLPDGQQQRDQQERPALAQLPRLHRQPQHPAGHQGRRGGHLLQIWQGRRLLRAQGLRLRPVLQREERPGRRGGRGRPHDRGTGARHQPGRRTEASQVEVDEALSRRHVQLIARPGLRLSERLLRQDVLLSIPGASPSPPSPHVPSGHPLEASEGQPERRREPAHQNQLLLLEEQPEDVPHHEGGRPAVHQEGADADQAQGGLPAGQPGAHGEGPQQEVRHEELQTGTGRGLLPQLLLLQQEGRRRQAGQRDPGAERLGGGGGRPAGGRGRGEEQRQRRGGG